MDCNPVHRYLLLILGFYKETGNEKYILSRLLNTGSLPLHVQTLFCRTCLILFIPTVNCKVKLTESDFTVECSLCDLKVCVEIDLGEKAPAENTVREFKFEDLFS